MRVSGRNVLACLLFIAVAAGRLGAEPAHEKPPAGMGLRHVPARSGGRCQAGAAAGSLRGA